MTSQDGAHGRPSDTSEWQVTQCTCGELTLRLGPIRIEFTPDEFARLDRLVREAMAHFEVAPSDSTVHVGGLMH